MRIHDEKPRRVEGIERMEDLTSAKLKKPGNSNPLIVDPMSAEVREYCKTHGIPYIKGMRAERDIWDSDISRSGVDAYTKVRTRGRVELRKEPRSEEEDREPPSSENKDEEAAETSEHWDATGQSNETKQKV